MNTRWFSDLGELTLEAGKCVEQEVTCSDFLPFLETFHIASYKCK